MHFHLPKPLHGWREFVGEVGIIVIGVLIALAFEAVVDDLQWRGKVREARTELRHEIGHNLALLDDRISEQPCVDRRLGELAIIITKASASGRLQPVGRISGADGYTFPVSVWESQMAAQTMTHFPAAQTAAISRVYRYIGSAHETNKAETAAWQTLRTMVGPGRPIDAASISRLIEALEVARSANEVVTFEKAAIQQLLVKGGLGSDFPQLDPKNPPVLVKGKRHICEPIGSPLGTY